MDGCGEVDLAVLEAMESYRQYVNEAVREALEDGRTIECESWYEYLSEYLLEELRASREGK